MSRRQQGIDASQGRWQVIPRTVCLITHGNDLLLLKRGPDRCIMPGKYNGVGGHVERGETIYRSAEREIHEETGLPVSGLRLRGIVNIDAGHPVRGIMLFVFTARAGHRDFKQTDEGILEWHPLNQLPQEELFEDFAILLPRILNSDDDPPFYAHCWYDENDALHIQLDEE